MDFEVNVTFFNCSIKAWVWTTDCGRVQKSQFNFWQSAMHQKQVFSLTPISSTSLILAEFLDRKLKNLLFYMAKFFENGKRQKYSQLENSYWFGYLDNIRTAWRPKPKSWWKKVSPLSIRESCCLYSNFFGLFSISHFRLIPIFFNIWLQTLQIPRHFSNLYLSLWCHTLLHPWDEFSILENWDDTEASKNNLWSQTRNSGFHLF